jgi:cyclase
MLTRRLIVCLDVKGGRVVKGVHFEGLRDVGDPVALAERYEAGGADEVVFLDISASTEERALLLDVVRRTAERLFIPLTVGGGIRGTDDVERALRAGADKVSVNTAAVERPELLTEAAARFGAQCVVASIDARRDVARRGAAAGWRVYTRGGRTPTDLDAVEWARECVRRGAGEILLTSIDRDGARCGYDLALTRAVSAAVSVPVIASGGAGSEGDVCDAIVRGGADAALVAGILHDGVATVGGIKRRMASEGISVRQVA